jgi:hypothetical protein
MPDPIPSVVEHQSRDEDDIDVIEWHGNTLPIGLEEPETVPHELCISAIVQREVIPLLGSRHENAASGEVVDAGEVDLLRHGEVGRNDTVDGWPSREGGTHIG